jgi:toxin-antitoxin system PIN domain toxin
MTLVDANVLLYAYDATSSRHAAARAWLEQTLNSEEEVGLPLVSLLAFVRIATNPAIFASPLTSDEAISLVIAWLSLPNATLVGPTARHWMTLADVAREGQAHGPQITDAHLATLAIEHGATLSTTDRDFGRFQGVRLLDPTSAS